MYKFSSVKPFGTSENITGQLKDAILAFAKERITFIN
jgi:hypothetical protein